MEAVSCSDQYEHISSDILYTTTNIPGPGIDLKEFESVFAVGCNCNETCTTNNCTCTRYQLNYKNNLILETSSKVILECNSNCKCLESCGNRVVQKGPINCLYIKCNSKGYGLYSAKKIEKGQFVCEYAGEVIGIEEAKQRLQNNDSRKLMNYVLIVSEYIGDKKIVTCIDPSKFGNIGRYANHSCEANSVLVPVRVENMIPRLCIFALKVIEPFEEITFNYGSNSSVNYSSTECKCDSPNCQKYLPYSAVDWKSSST